jgi:hypothetical protein
MSLRNPADSLKLMSKEIARTESGVGDTAWMKIQTSWSHDKIARLCRLKRVPGAFQAQKGVRGSMWYFRKARTLAWLESLEVK